MPLAKARNHAASLCKTERMIFLDVDCIPSTKMIDQFDKALQEDERLWMGSAKYLPVDATLIDWTQDDLANLAVEHPLQPKLLEGERKLSDQYDLFWSLCFAVTKQLYKRIGGFDPAFDGYGGEDTDFAFSARRANVPFGFVGATAYHQHHAVYKPPLNHFGEIISNAQRFHSKWGHWPMLSWLKAFQAGGFIDFDERIDQWQILREPSTDEVEAAKTMTPAGF